MRYPIIVVRKVVTKVVTEVCYTVLPTLCLLCACAQQTQKVTIEIKDVNGNLLSCGVQLVLVGLFVLLIFFYRDTIKKVRALGKSKQMTQTNYCTVFVQ